MKTKILYLNEDAYNNGKISGKYFKEIIKENIQYYEEKLNNEEYKNQIIKLLNKLQNEYPQYYEEIKGKADGAGVGFIQYFAMMCPELSKVQSHCTTIMCKKSNGNFIISHNEDDNYQEGNFAISKINVSNGWFATNDIWNMPFGNGFSWNSSGIIKTINYTHEPNMNLDNLSRYFSQRHISEANSIEDLIKRTRELKPASGYHVNAIDIKNNIAVSIEVYPDDIDVQYINDYYIHSNHYIHNRYKNNIQTDEGSNSVFRLEKASQLFTKLNDRNLLNIKNILDYRSKEDEFENSIFQTYKDPYITGMNFSFDIDLNKEIKIYIYPNKEILTFDYELKNISKAENID